MQSKHRFKTRLGPDKFKCVNCGLIRTGGITNYSYENPEAQSKKERYGYKACRNGQ